MNTTQQVKQWFETAFPEPTPPQASTQAGCVVEEVAELVEALGLDATVITAIADKLKESSSLMVSATDTKWRVDVADACADIAVTVIGLCHILGIDFEACLAEVNRANYSKFENGKPVYGKYGKVTRGKDYVPPNLEEIVNGG